MPGSFTVTTASWTRRDGEWVVSVPVSGVVSNPTDLTGAHATVTRRDGGTAEVVLGQYLGQRGRPGSRFVGAWMFRPARETGAETAATPTPVPPMGTHVLDADTDRPQVYRVTRSRRGRGYPQAHRLDITRRTATGRARWIYAGRSPFARLSADTLLTEAQARQIGARLGFCANCGRALTADVSVDRGIGPVCFRRIGEYRRAALLAARDAIARDDTEIRSELAARIDRARHAAESMIAETEYHRSQFDLDAELEDDNSDPEDDAAQAAPVTLDEQARAALWTVEATA